MKPDVNEGILEGMGTHTALVGRVADEGLLADSLQGAVDGDPCAVLVHGEAGVGKTRLVTEVTDGWASAGHRVLWGRCQRFGATASPYLPLAQAIGHWAHAADDAERDSALDGLSLLGAVVPGLGHTDGGAAHGSVVSAVATLMERIADDAPLALVIDDLQWADTSSLDALAYLVGGFADGHRLTVIGSYRDTDLQDGHPLLGWLGDVRRMPRVQLHPLGRLDLLGTEELVTRIVGADGAATRAVEVHARADGNPYLTGLILAHGDSGTREADTLGEALLSSWHRLGGTARMLAQGLAVGGRPVQRSVMEASLVSWALGPDDVAPALDEATAAGVTVADRHGRVWFHHPLLAEVIEETLDAGDRRRLHDLYVKAWTDADTGRALDRMAHLALHHHGAGHADEAFAWSLRAADAATEAIGHAEAWEHLQRAVDLWPDLAPTTREEYPGGLLALRRRTARSAGSCGEYASSVEQLERAEELVDAGEDPLTAFHIRLELILMRDRAGMSSGFTIDETLLDLTAGHPTSPERVIALSVVGYARFANGLSGDEAVAEGNRIAEGMDDMLAVAWARGVRADTHKESAGALADARYAAETSLAHLFPLLTAPTALWLCNVLEWRGLYVEAAGTMAATFAEMVERGAATEAIVPGVCAAHAMMETGRWAEASQILRLVQSRRANTRWSAEARALAAVLEARRGGLSTARNHLARAHELTPKGGQYEAEAVIRADLTVALLAGEHVQTLLTWGGNSSRATDADFNYDQIYALAAMHAAAAVRRHLLTPERAVELLEAQAATDAWGRPPFGDRHARPQVEVMATLHDACLAEIAGEADQATRWTSARDAGDAADHPWHAAYAAVRLAHTLTVQSPRQATDALRDAHRRAAELGAAPLVEEVEQIAAQAHVNLTPPDPAEVEVDGIPDLTPREREVVALVVAGRTYAEMATELFISEKTVSVHVSNLLRKTGTRNRVELADLART